jgi:hypothetical protein
MCVTMLLSLPNMVCKRITNKYLFKIKPKIPSEFLFYRHTKTTNIISTNNSSKENRIIRDNYLLNYTDDFEIKLLI